MQGNQGDFYPLLEYALLSRAIQTSDMITKILINLQYLSLLSKPSFSNVNLIEFKEVINYNEFITLGSYFITDTLL